MPGNWDAEKLLLLFTKAMLEESDKLLDEGCALEITPAEEIAVRKLFEAPLSGWTVLEFAFGSVWVRAAVGVVAVKL